jgi:threonylcarbamoyladenosine tRNA methylthiotransferase MtaB
MSRSFLKMFFNITTFGCKANQYDSSAIAELMKLKGYVPFESLSDCADFTIERAPVHIINSCTVTENSDRKIKNLISRLKKDSPGVKIILCGCLPKAFAEKAKTFGADVVIEGKFSLPGDTEAELPFSPQSQRTRAFLKIQDGCNRECAFCIIPKARGKSTSRTIDEITAEAHKLILAGHKEIVITGINLCAYEFGLVNAVQAVAQTGIHRLRLGSLEPDMISESDIIRLSELTKPPHPAKPACLCPHLHLSLQSGSDCVLKRMNRRYTTDDYRKIVKLIRERFTGTSCRESGVAVTTDIIVGFPGETDEEFAQTLAFAEEMRFAKIHVFAFSKREGTPAAVMPEQVSKAIKRERVSVLCELERRLRAEFFKGLIASEQEVLIEKAGFGHTPCYTPVVIAGDCNYKKNELVRVRITKAEGEFCIGE